MTHVSILSYCIDNHRSIKEYRKEKRAFMMEKEQGSRCACDKVTKVHYYQGGTPILEEIAFEEALKDTTSENGIESRFAQALNNCKAYCFWILFVICLEVCSVLSSLSFDVSQVPQTGRINQILTNETNIEEIVVFD
jgi:hypothetical protein